MDLLYIFGHGKTYEFASQKDWRSHALGTPENWPRELTNALSMILHCQQPMCLYWGDQHFCFYNEAYIPMLGERKHPEAFGLPAMDIWPNLWEESCAQQVQLVMKQGISVNRIDESSALRNNDIRIESYFNLSMSPIYTESGAIHGVLAIAQNLTEKVMSERGRLENEIRLKMALKSARMGLWSVNLKSGKLDFSHGIHRFLGYDTEEKNIFEFLARVVHVDDFERVKLEFNTSVAQNRPFRAEFRVLREDRELRWVLATGEIRDDPKEQAVSLDGIIMDIHEQKLSTMELARAKAAAEIANESKSSFLANMSHEIRTPLTAVLGFAELLRDEYLSANERLNSIGRIERSGQALLKLIDNILDLSKIEAGQLTIHRESFSPKDLVAEVVALLTPTATYKDLELRMEVDPDLPSRVLSDPGCVRQVIVNLVGNAIKFTDQGFVCVKVSMDSNKYLKIEVSDSGIGISKESQSRLFQAFSQADDSITRQFGGTGLGLALSRRLCECLGGSLVLAESEYGKGSRFVAQVEAVPDFQVRNELVCNGKIDDTKEAHSLKGMRILVAEDGVDNKALFKLYLEPTGADLTLVSDGNEAYIKAKSGNYDLILMDLQMPGMDGLQATRQLRKIGYKGPIVALTAHAMKEEVRRSLEAGCNAHLNKPITRSHLIRAVKEHALKVSKFH